MIDIEHYQPNDKMVKEVKKTFFGFLRKKRQTTSRPKTSHRQKRQETDPYVVSILKRLFKYPRNL